MPNIKNDEYEIYEHIARRQYDWALQKLKASLSTSGYKENRRAENLLNIIEANKDPEIPADLKGIITIEKPEMIDTTLWYPTEKQQEYLKDIQKVNENAKALSIYGIRYLNSVLLHGLPGTGKTMFARVVAKTLNVPLCYIRTSTVIQSLMGGTGKTLTKIFDFIMGTKYVLFLDELDAYGKKRVNADTGAAQEAANITIALLTLMDSLPNGFTLIAATNKPDLLDPALLRRFERKVLIEPFTAKEAKEFIFDYMSRIFPRQILLKDVSSAIPDDKSKFIQSQLIGTLNHALIRAWPCMPNIKTIFADYYEEEK